MRPRRVAAAAESGHEVPVGFAFAQHFLAIRIERVVDDPFGRVDGVIVLEAEMAKALGDGLEPGALALMIKRVVGIGAVDDFSEQDKRGIAAAILSLPGRLERAFPTVLSELADVPAIT